MTKEEMGLGSVTEAEMWWRTHYTWLLESGYRLRQRYAPDWVPSWKGKSGMEAFRHEDGQRAREAFVMDAVRLSDGTVVILKRVNVGSNPLEVDMTKLVNLPHLRDNPANHCVHFYGVLHSPINPGYDILIIPLLRPFWKPKFETIGEIVGCVLQLFEGLRFMHDNLVAHRDPHRRNIMMDASPMYPEGWHFSYIGEGDMTRDFSKPAVPLSRTMAPTPVKYYFVDFGIAVIFDNSDEPHLIEPVLSGDRTAPELQGDKEFQPTDPFPTDVYYIGNTIREVFFGRDELFSGYRGMGFMKSLISDMTQKDPSKRPTMAEAEARMKKIAAGMTQLRLRSPAVSRREFFLFSIFRGFGRWKRSWKQWRQGVPALRELSS